jgi:BASS family bile acid:Na+ symporter
MNWRSRVDIVVRAIHDKLVWVLLGTYLLAVVVPAPGLALRSVSAGAVHAGHASLPLSAPTLLLELLLFNASLGVNAGEIARLVHRVRVALVGLFANSALPLLFTAAVAVVFSRWHDTDEVQSLLVGLAFVAAMPIAGSSTAWSQNAEGNVALSLGLVLASTLISPLLTPLEFRIVAGFTTGDYSEDLLELAGGSTELFLVSAVLAPSALAMAARAMIGTARVSRVLPLVKLVNTGVLVTLNYINAAATLPNVLRRPDGDYLLLVFGVTTVLCSSAFIAGRSIGALVGAREAERISLMFGLGMNNNGSGLVLATTTMADHPNVLLTIVAYNLVQQVVAGVADHLQLRITRTSTVEQIPPVKTRNSLH